MHNSGILERQYWAKQNKQELWKHEGKNINKEARKNNEMQLKSPGRNVEGEKNIDSQAKK